MSSPRRFLLDRTPEEGPPELLAADAEHALRVLRLGVGDRLLGLDGRGRAWELEVTRAERRGLELAALGDPTTEPAPGQPGAPLPWIEAWCPLPKGGRAEDMLERLTQLGLARLVPLVTERTEPQARQVSAGRLERLERRAREALKQCGRLWLPEVASAEPFASLLQKEGTRCRLERSAESLLPTALREARPASGWTREEPLVLIAGPEGGWTEAEAAALADAGVQEARLGPHVLRIETALEAALAVTVSTS